MKKIIEYIREKKILDKIFFYGRKIIYVWISLSAVVLVVWGIYEVYIYETITKQKNNIIIKIAPNSSCPENFPIEYIIFNKSSRIIKNTTIYPIAHQDGFSKNLAEYYARIESDKIINPGEGWKRCWSGELDTVYGRGYKPQNLIWEVEKFYVEFK